MANDTSANPWKLNTTGSTTLLPSLVKITSITWANYTPGTSNCIIQDANGKDIFNASIPSAQTIMTPVTQTNIGWVRGLILNTLTNGEVTVTIGAGK